MGRFIRIAIMFGPMIYKGIKKFMAKRNNDNPPPPTTPTDGQEPDNPNTH